MTERTDGLLADLTIEEAASLTAGIDLWRTPPVARLGIPSVKMTDGPIGARGDRYTGGPTSTCFPNGSALAATWDVELIGRVGVALGEAARAKGSHVLLAPTVNLHRTPLGGRHFECFSEDPFLTARMAVAYVRGVQSVGVAACVKHLVANDAETDRFTASSEVDERALRELYLVPFEAALLEAGAWSVMGAYNKLAGTWCCEHPWLLTTLLREEWGWDGLVVSDWWATHSTVESATAGLDVEMPGPSLFQGEKLVGVVDEAVVREKAGRVLLLAERTGALDEPSPVEETSDDTPEHRALAREAAAAAIVLLQDESGLLPLDPAAVGTVAVVGPNADPSEVLGGGSAYVAAPYAVSILDGLRSRLGERVVHEPGVRATRGTPRLDTRRIDGGFTIELGSGGVERSPRQSFRWGGEETVHVRGTFVPVASGEHLFKVRTTGTASITVDGRPGDDGPVELVAGEPAELVVDWRRGENPGVFDGLDLRCAEPLPDDAFDRAVAAARDAALAVVVVGLDGEWETEGRDRDDLSLPGGQADLIRAVAAVQPNTVVVVNAGAAVELSWADDVPTVVWSWYGGQEAGNALADVLLGDVDASGRMPTTLWHDLDGVPSGVPVDGKVVYSEGLALGYRREGASPRFPFGHGLSYTTFEYGEATVSADVVAPGEPVTVSVEVTNTGERAGVETVQVYVADPESSLPRPAKELKGFARVRLDPGESSTASVVLDGRARSYWDPARHGWREEPGRFQALVGRSAGDVRRTVGFEVAGAG